MMTSHNRPINIQNLKEVQHWMRELNISKEELMAAVEKFGTSPEAVRFGLQNSTRGQVNLH